MGILTAASWFTKSPFVTASLFTDSLSSVVSLQNIYPKSPLALKIQNLIKSHPNKKLYINWIKAHDGNAGNESADRLAKEATFKDPTPPDSPQGIKYPISLIRKNLREEEMVAWQKRWREGDVGRFTFNIFPQVNNFIKIKNQVLIYFITNKGSFPEYLHKIGKRDTNTCPCSDGGPPLIGGPLHYLATKCLTSPDFIKMRTNESLHDYIVRIDNSKKHIQTVKKIYNYLNEEFSFITSKY